VTGEPQTVLTVARLHEQKGLEVVVHAARELPGVRFLIAGEGPERPSLERLTRSLGVEERVVLLGHRDDITALLGDADLFVLPSRYEGFPLALLEAMASGVAVVASDIPGITELVTDDSRGLLVAPGDVSGFTRAIGELLGHDARRAALGRAARQLVEERYDADELARRVVAQYDVARP
jgi:glycosyltransferase involved in cell wall biosynthesis